MVGVSQTKRTRPPIETNHALRQFQSFCSSVRHDSNLCRQQVLIDCLIKIFICEDVVVKGCWGCPNAMANSCPFVR